MLSDKLSECSTRILDPGFFSDPGSGSRGNKVFDPESATLFISNLEGKDNEDELELHVDLLVLLDDGLQVPLHGPLAAALMPAVVRVRADRQSNTRAHSGQKE